MLLEGPSRMASIRENRCFQQLVLWQAPRVNIPWGWAEELNVVCSTMAGFILENWTDPSGSCVKHRLLWVLLLPRSASPGLQQGSWGQQEPWLPPCLPFTAALTPLVTWLGTWGHGVTKNDSYSSRISSGCLEGSWERWLHFRSEWDCSGTQIFKWVVTMWPVCVRMIFLIAKI